MSEYPQQGGHVSGRPRPQQFPAASGRPQQPQQYPTAGYEQRPPAGYEPRPAAPGYPRPHGTPLGRIVAGVFLGLLAWTVLMVLVSLVLVAALASRIEDAFSDAGAGVALSDDCKAAIDDDRGIVAACAGDDATAILEYQSN